MTISNVAAEEASLLVLCPSEIYEDVWCSDQYRVDGADTISFAAPDLEHVMIYVSYKLCEQVGFKLYDELDDDGMLEISNPCASPTPPDGDEPGEPEWLLAALEELEASSGEDPQWVGTTFWGSATWSEWDTDKALVTYVDQPFTLSIDSASSDDRHWTCETYADQVPERDGLDDAMDFIDHLHGAALQGSFGGILDTVADGPGPLYPEFVPADCELHLPTPVGYRPGDNPIVVSSDRIDAGLVAEWTQDDGVLYDMGPHGFCSPGSDIRLERVGTIAETGGSVIRGDWVEWQGCTDGPGRAPGLVSPHNPVEGVRCLTNVLAWDVNFYSADPAVHDRFLRSEQELYTGETVVPIDEETYTSCQLTTKGTFYAFSLPPGGSTSVPGGVTAEQVRRVMHAYGLARSGAVPEETAELGFFEVVAEIRAEAITWIVRNMPVYDANEGSWSSFESYAIDLGHDSGVSPDSRLAQDPVGTAMDMAFGDATVDDMVGWIGLD